MYAEGKARIKESGKAFLNPAGKASRDLSIAYVKLLAEKGSALLDATAATGIRAIRYAKEAGIRRPDDPGDKPNRLQGNEIQHYTQQDKGGCAQ